MDEGQRAAEARHQQRPRRHHAARRLSGGIAARLPRRRDLSRYRDFRAPPPPLRGQHRLQGSARPAWYALFRHVARRALAGDHRISGPSVVHRRAISPRAEIAPLRAAPAVLLLHRGGGGAEPAGVISSTVDFARCPAGRRTFGVSEAQTSGESHDLRNARLPHRAGPPAGSLGAVPEHDAETLGQARHQAGRLLDHADRRFQPGADVSPRLGVARRPREEVERVHGRPRGLFMTEPNPIVSVGKARFSNALPLALIAGPCALESRAHAFEMAAALQEITARLGIGLVYKTSFDKANRTSASSARGLGLDQALPIFAELREKLGLAVLTDVHEPEQC